MTPAVRDVWDRHPGYLLAFVINVTMALYLGVTAITLPTRFNAPAYVALRETLGVTGWGVALVVYGVALTACAWLTAKAILVTFSSGAVMYLLLSIWFAMALRDPMASPWGPIFLFLGAWQLTQWVAYREAVQRIKAAEPPPPSDLKEW